MYVIADICVTPLVSSPSVRSEVALAYKILSDTGMPVHLHGYGTNIEGDYETIIAALRRILEELHQSGVPRISTTLRLDSRTDKSQSIVQKIAAVQEELAINANKTYKS